MNIESLQTLYDGYLEKAIQVEQNRKPGEGIFGIGKKPSDDPCHERFLEELKKWLEAFERSEPESPMIREALSLIYQAPKKFPEPKSSYWMLIAAQGLTKELIPRLNAPDAEALATEFSAAYKRWERLPIQKEILDALIRAEKRSNIAY